MAVRIQSIKKCGFLRQLAQKAIASATSLTDTLIAAQSGHFVDTFSRGRLVVSNSGGGQSGSFEISLPDKEWTQDNVFGLIEELIQMTAARIAAGTPDDDGGAKIVIGALRDALIQDINAGLFPQSGVRSQMGDFSGLNYPASQLGAGPGQ